MPWRAPGFTLPELIITIAIAALLATQVAPAMGDLISGTRARLIRDSVFHELRVARATAARLGRQSVVCTTQSSRCDSDASWEDGWFVFVDADSDGTCRDTDNDLHCDGDGGKIVSIHEGVNPDKALIVANSHVAHKVVFRSWGEAYGSNGRITICPPQPTEDWRRLAHGLVISNPGRIRTAAESDLLDCSAHW